MPDPAHPTAWKRPVPLPGPINTERTLVRWYVPDDAEALHRAVAPHRQALLPWLPWAGREHGTAEDSLRVIDRFTWDRSAAGCTDFPMGIFDRRTGILLGGTGLHRIVPDLGEAEIGYWIHAQRRGQGYCTEAVAGVIQAAFGAWGLRRIKICCAGSNRASQRIPEKLGLRLEGTERAARWVEGVGWDAHLTYAVLAEEWDPEAQRVRSTHGESV